MYDVQQIKPGKFWYAVGVVILLAGIAGAVPLAVFSIWIIFGSGEEFLAPGTHTVKITEPGKYVIWNNARTSFNGKMYRTAEDLPEDMELKVADPENQELPLEPHVGSSKSTPSRASYSVASFVANEPGDYTITVSNLDQDCVLAVQQSELPAVAGLFGGFLLATITFVAAVIIIVVVAIKRANCKKRLRAENTQ